MHSDTDILIQQTIANWQWYHGLAVALGSAGVIAGLLLGYWAPWIFIDFYIRITSCKK